MKNLGGTWKPMDLVQTRPTYQDPLNSQPLFSIYLFITNKFKKKKSIKLYNSKFKRVKPKTKRINK